MLRLLSPIQLCLCLPLFFLPWVEVQCIPKAPPAGAKPDPMMVGMPTGPQPLVAQSGFQAATGGYTFSNPLLAGEGGMGGPNMGQPKAGPKKDSGPPAAPLLFLVPVALLGGIVVGFLPMKGGARKLILAACCVVALGTIAVQAGVLGFPVMKAVEEDAAKDPSKGGGGPNQLEPGMTLKLAWKVPLYATLFFLVGALATSFLGGSGKAAPKSRRRYDEDDDRDDEEDRPRRRRPVDDDSDGDDDDRPRRRARRDD